MTLLAVVNRVVLLTRIIHKATDYFESGPILIEFTGFLACFPKKQPVYSTPESIERHISHDPPRHVAGHAPRAIVRPI